MSPWVKEGLNQSVTWHFCPILNKKILFWTVSGHKNLTFLSYYLCLFNKSKKFVFWKLKMWRQSGARGRGGYHRHGYVRGWVLCEMRSGGRGSKIVQKSAILLGWPLTFMTFYYKSTLLEELHKISASDYPLPYMLFSASNQLRCYVNVLVKKRVPKALNPKATFNDSNGWKRNLRHD